MEKISLIIVEDHAATRLGLRVVLAQEPDIEVVDVAGTFEEAVKKCREHRPDVILLDLHLPDSSGPKTLVSTFVPLSRVIVFSGAATKTLIRKTLELGAVGFVSKSDDIELLLAVIRDAMKEPIRSAPNFAGAADALPSGLEFEETEDPNIGKIVDERYRITEILGFGSYSVVYKAQDLLTPQTVALKLLHTHLAMVRESAMRFQREANAARVLDHPNIAAVYHSGVTEWGQPYMAMEYLCGTTLHAEMERDRKMKPQRAISIVTQVCDALSAAHATGIVHRDIKPANIHLSEGDHVKLLDFGLVKVVTGEGIDLASLTASGSTIGTPCYMSPEQCYGKELDARSDLYALGCVMFEMLAGRRMFDSQSIVDVMLAQAGTKPDFKPLADADVPRSLIAIIDRLLQKDRTHRYKDAAELKSHLQTVNTEKSKLSFLKRWTE